MEHQFWKAYWSEKTNGEHRSQEDFFLEAEAKEKLFHLGDGGSILDFGCGSADLLVYYTPFYSVCMGVDGSELMLEKARRRLGHFDVQNKVLLGHADDTSVWDYVHDTLGDSFLFDRITAGQVVQYLDESIIDHFISHSLQHLSSTGKICLFDVVDSRTSELWQAGLFSRKRLDMHVLIKLYARRLLALRKKLLGKPIHPLGYSYPPSFFAELVKKHGLQISFAHSMYYEYRYHVILSR